MNIRKARIAIAAAALISSSAGLAYDEAQYASVIGGQPDCAWCDLSGADLRNVNFAGADLSGANLTGADISGATLTRADLSGADLTGARVDGADLSGSRLAGADLDQVDLSEAVISGTVLEKAYCDWATKLPAGSDLVCIGVTIERK